jgi:uncharacterized protein
MNHRHWIAAAAGTAAALAAYASLIEPRWLQVRRERIHIRTLPDAFEGLRIGLISDLHVEAGQEPRLVRRAVRALRRAGAQLVAVTGDLAEDEEALHSVLDALTHLHPPLGVYAVPGNHDHRAGIETWHRAVSARKAVVDLTNRYTMIERLGATLCLAGVDDHIEGRPILVLPPPPTRHLTILLAHSPDQAERCRRSHDAIDLILSGHTHGGQVRFPIIGAPVNSAVHHHLYEDGLRRRPWTQVYTSRGLGTTRLPIRFLTRPEVAILELTQGARPPLGAPRHPTSLELPTGSAHIATPFEPQTDGDPHPRGEYENP